MEYRYDAWGRQISKTGSKASNLGTINPFRYRGYVLDEDVGLYYLRSRYYNPWWGRFISADSVLGQIGGLLQHNLFAYGLNDPVDYADVDGEFAISVWVTAGIIGAVFGAATQMVSNAMFGVEIWKGVAGAAIGGAVYNIVSMTGAGVVGAAYASAAVENTVNEILMYTSGENEVTSENISNSISTVLGASFIGGTAYLATGNIADVAVKVPYGKLSENVSALLAGKMLKQTMVQTAYNMSASPFTVSINNKIRENCFGQPTLLTD